MLNRGSVNDEHEGRLTGDDIVVAVMTGIGGDRLDSAVGRNRGVDVQPFPSSRRLTTAAVRAGRRIVPMHGLLEVDVTEARGLLGAHEPPLSLTAFVIASVARAAAAQSGGARLSGLARPTGAAPPCRRSDAHRGADRARTFRAGARGSRRGRALRPRDQ